MMNKLSDRITDLALNRTALLTDTLRGLRLGGAAAQFEFDDKVPPRIDCLILGKEHYSQSSRSLPVQSRKELSKILQLEAAQSEPLLLYRIGAYVDGKREVSCWEVKRQLLEKHGLKPLFIVPESALLLTEGVKQLLTVKRGDNCFWFVNDQGRLLSAQQQGLLSNEMMFLAATGISDQIETLVLDEAQYLQRISRALLPLLVRNLGGFHSGLRPLKSIDWLSHARFSGTASVVLVAAYLALSSLYLDFRLSAAEQDALEYGSKTQAIFALKKQLNKLQQQNEQLNGVVNHVSAPSVIWRFLAPLAKRGVKIERLGMLPDGMFVIRMQAPKATDVLAFINTDPAVVAPKFQGQNNIKDGKETFTVVFKIKRNS